MKTLFTFQDIVSIYYNKREAFIFLSRQVYFKYRHQAKFLLHKCSKLEGGRGLKHFLDEQIA